MQFKDGAKVVTTGGETVGSIDRVVIDPQSKEVTHVVVRKGFLLPEDKVVPIDYFQSAAEDQAILHSNTDDLDALPSFEETHYIPWEEETVSPRTGYAQSYYWYPPAATPWWGYPGYAGYYGYAPYVTPRQVERNIPKGSVPLEEGAKVVSADGEAVGSVKRIFTDTKTDRVTHFVVSEGLIFKEKRLIPTAWVKNIKEDEVELSVDAKVVERLREYED